MYPYMSKRQCLAFKFSLNIHVELLNNVCWLILSEAELNSRAFKLFLFWKLRVWPSFRQRKQQSVSLSQESKVEKFTSVLFPKRPQPLKCDSINLHSTFLICLSEQKLPHQDFFNWALCGCSGRLTQVHVGHWAKKCYLLTHGQRADPPF